MRKTVFLKTYPSLHDCDRREILRYAGARGQSDEGLEKLLDECLRECEGVFSYRVCFTELTSAEFFEIFPPSESAKAYTDGSDKIVVFAATVGLAIDRLINRYAGVSAVKSLLFQAIGTERIESLCDLFCEERSFKRAGRRFSPGYGDFPLLAQREMFALLNPSKHIGVALTDALLMSPTKSVTAAFGIKDFVCTTDGGADCKECGKEDCAFKKD